MSLIEMWKLHDDGERANSCCSWVLNQIELQIREWYVIRHHYAFARGDVEAAEFAEMKLKERLFVSVWDANLNTLGEKLVLTEYEAKEFARSFPEMEGYNALVVYDEQD